MAPSLPSVQGGAMNDLHELEVYRGAVKNAARTFMAILDQIGRVTEKSREVSLAKTKIEEAELWALKHLEAHRG